MRICTAPTVFDNLKREDVVAWLEQGPTVALKAALDQRIREITDNLAQISLGPSDTDLGLTYRAVRAQLDAHMQLQRWMLQSESRARRDDDAQG